MADQRNRMLKKLIELIGKPEEERPEEEIQALAPWLAKVTALFHSLSKEKILLLLKLCTHENVSRDHVIIRQGDVGDCFYVMLSGKSSLYIDLNVLDDPQRVSSAEEEKEEKKEEKEKEEEEGGDVWEEVWERSGKRCFRLDRTKFGTFVCGYETGKGFGEVALIDPRSLRTGSVIADDDCDLLVIGRRLFDETLRERLETEWDKRRAFVDSSPLFGAWPARNRRLLDASLVRRVFPFDSGVVRQGGAFAGLHFIVRGEAVVSVDVDLHRSQYPKILLDRRARVLAEIGRSTRKEEQEQESAGNRRPEAEVKGRRTRKSITVCAIDQTEVIGALEFVLGLDTYAQTIVSTTDLEVLSLDVKGIERLLGRGRQSPTALYLEDKVRDRLSARLTFSSGSKVELYRHLLNSLDERKRIRETQSRKSAPSRTPHFRISSPSSDQNPRGSGDDRTVPSAAPARGKTPDDPPRPPSTLVTLDPTADLVHGSSTLAAYYLSHIIQRSKEFSRAYLRSREGGYGRQNETLSSGGRRLIVDRATRLLPRSRRELERVALGGVLKKEQRPNRTQSQAIHRYLGPSPAATADPERVQLARWLVQRSPSTRSFGRSRDGSRDDEADDDDDVMLGLEETLSDGRLRDVVMKIGGYHDDVSARRRCSIVQSVFFGGGGSRRPAWAGDRRPAWAGDRRPAWAGDGRRSGVTTKVGRPKMTPAATAAFDPEASDENLRRLEEKLRKFCVQMADEKDNDVPIVQKLRRFEITNAEDIPIPAGTVYVCRRFRGNLDIVGSHGNSVKSGDVVRDEESSAKARQTTRRFMIPKTAYPLLTSVLTNQETEASRWSTAQSNE